MSHPAVIKATKIANRAVTQGWKGQLDSNVLTSVDIKPFRLTTLFLKRNDEKLEITWHNTAFNHGTYSLFDFTATITEMLEVKAMVMDWPDILFINQLVGGLTPATTNLYRRLPFNWETDDNEEIMSKLVGAKVFWYDHEYARLRADVVLPPKGAKAKVYSIRQVGHRKMFAFIGAQAGQRNILLDTIIKVAK